MNQSKYENESIKALDDLHYKILEVKIKKIQSNFENKISLFKAKEDRNGKSPGRRNF